MMNKNNNQIYDLDDSIDLIELLSILWKRKFLLLK